MSRIVTLTTDFGTRDAYVAAMKGTILGIEPSARLVDVSHEIAPQDVMEAAFVLRDAAPYFPEGTVHLVVVDPGVGTARRPVAVRHDGRLFVGPDNGLFPLVLDGAAPEAAVVLDRPRYWRTEEVSSTFHGRDVFAPVAGHLAAGAPIEDVGSPAGALAPLHWALPIADDQGIQGWIVHVDRFGNCITNITRTLFEKYGRDRFVKGFVGTAILQGLHATYGRVEPGEPLLLFNSSDVLEVAVNTGNAAELLGIRRGARINLVFRDA